MANPNPLESAETRDNTQRVADGTLSRNLHDELRASSTDVKALAHASAKPSMGLPEVELSSGSDHSPPKAPESKPQLDCLDGSKVWIDARTAHEVVQDAAGKVYEVKYHDSDHTVIEQLKEPDGSVITRTGKGQYIRETPGGKTETFNGEITMYGTSITYKHADGHKVICNGDGSRVETDREGRITKSTDPSGKTTEFEYQKGADGKMEVSKVHLSDGSVLQRDKHGTWDKYDQSGNKHKDEYWYVRPGKHSGTIDVRGPTGTLEYSQRGTHKPLPY